MTVELLTFVVAVLTAAAVALLVVMGVRQGRRTSGVEVRVDEVHAVVRHLDARLDAVAVQCDAHDARVKSLEAAGAPARSN